MDELPEWTFPFFDCYTGPYWSDGKWQGSTARGNCAPESRLDELSRGHDTSFALCSDLDCLDRADELYYQESREMSFIPRIIGAMPLYGNKLGRMAARLMGIGYTGSEFNGAKSGNMEVYHPQLEDSNIPPEGFQPKGEAAANVGGAHYLPNGYFKPIGLGNRASPMTPALPAADTPPKMNTPVPRLALQNVRNVNTEYDNTNVRRGRTKILNEWKYWSQKSREPLRKKTPKFYELRRKNTIHVS